MVLWTSCVDESLTSIDDVEFPDGAFLIAQRRGCFLDEEG